MKQILKYIELPWQISPSASDLKLQVKETGPDYQSVVLCLVFFNSKEAREASGVTAKSYQLQGKEKVFASDREGFIQIQFKNPIFSAMEIKASDEVTSDFNIYDDSLLPCSDSKEPINIRLDKYREHWNGTGNSPRPGFYEILNSSLLSDRFKPYKSIGYGHYIIEGSDMYVEVVASAWNWIPAFPE